MTDLDPATLEKFQRFQAMLAESPEIVEALNSPEILALAAKAATKKNPQPAPAADPQPAYPVIGYGVSDDASVLSEMTTPTVVTKMTVEEDEYYPEVDGTGVSSSGHGGGPRRMPMRIGVSAKEDGSLPPPPPKQRNRLGQQKLRQSRLARKPKIMAAPMSKIIENDNSASTNETAKPPLTSKNKVWKPNSEKNEPHPFLSTVPRRVSSHRDKTPRRAANSRYINRNKSMPTSLKLNGNSSTSDDSFPDEDDDIYSSEFSKVSSEFSRSDLSKLSDKTNSTASVMNGKLTESKARLTTLSKAGLSPPRTTFRKSLASNGTTRAINGRGVTRNRSMPMGSKSSNHSGASSDSMQEDDANTKTSSESNSSSVSKEKPTKEVRDGRGIFQNTGSKKSRGRSAPKMRLVPASKSVDSADISAKGTMILSDHRTKPRTRSSSLSKYSNRSSSSKSGDTGRSSSAKNLVKSLQSDEESDDINSDDLSDSSGEEETKSRPTVTRRWKPPVVDKAALPPAFRLSSSSHHSDKSDDGPLRRSGSQKSHDSFKVASRSSTHSESRSEEQKEIFLSSDDEEDYVPQSVRKAAGKEGSSQKPEEFRQYVSEITQVIQSENTSRPDDFVGASFTATRRKRASKKKFGNPPEPRANDWLGSDKAQRRTWKAK
jgi:hypothetical protein